jgi:hypothetical protein
LTDSNILRPKDKLLDWTSIKKNFKLVNEECNTVSPIDISYVHNGYSPLSVKIIELWMRSGGLKNMQDKLRHIPGQNMSPANEADLFVPEQQRKKKILIYFVGGMTHAEIASVRFLNGLFPDFKFIIATTCIINGNKAIEVMRTEFDNQLDTEDAMKRK